MLDQKEMPTKAQTLALAKEIVAKYEGTELETLPAELLLAKGVIAMYGEMIRAKNYGHSVNKSSKYFPENDSLDWGQSWE